MISPGIDLYYCVNHIEFFLNYFTDWCFDIFDVFPHNLGPFFYPLTILVIWIFETFPFFNGLEPFFHNLSGSVEPPRHGKSTPCIDKTTWSDPLRANGVREGREVIIVTDLPFPRRIMSGTSSRRNRLSVFFLSPFIRTSPFV